jgi:hypothetical protein
VKRSAALVFYVGLMVAGVALEMATLISMLTLYSFLVWWLQ